MTTNPPSIQFELLDQLAPVVEENLGLLLDVDAAWQPSDFLPDFSKPTWHAALGELQEGAGALSDDLLAVLAGNMVTEEALPSYAISLNRIARDPEGDSPSPWARWMRGWIAEENRHGDLLNAYLRLTGRIDMRRVELTIHHLLVGGFNPRAFMDPYAGLIYTAFQERATTISHANVGRLAGQQGDATLARLCKRIAADESRHEQFYTRIMREVVDRDPETAILLFRRMMKRTIAMPARNMADGLTPGLFDRYAIVAQKLGVYTVVDYAGIVGYLVNAWSIGARSVAGQAAKAQEFLCVQAERLTDLAKKMQDEIDARPVTEFPWIATPPGAPDSTSCIAHHLRSLREGF